MCEKMAKKKGVLVFLMNRIHPSNAAAAAAAAAAECCCAREFNLPVIYVNWSRHDSFPKTMGSSVYL